MIKCHVMAFLTCEPALCFLFRSQDESAVDCGGHLPLRWDLLSSAALHSLHLTQEVGNTWLTHTCLGIKRFSSSNLIALPWLKISASTNYCLERSVVCSKLAAGKKWLLIHFTFKWERLSSTLSVSWVWPQFTVNKNICKHTNKVLAHQCGISPNCWHFFVPPSLCLPLFELMYQLELRAPLYREGKVIRLWWFHRCTWHNQ